MAKTYPKEKVVEFLSFVAKLSPPKQREVLKVMTGSLDDLSSLWRDQKLLALLSTKEIVRLEGVVASMGRASGQQSREQQIVQAIERVVANPQSAESQLRKIASYTGTGSRADKKTVKKLATLIEGVKQEEKLRFKDLSKMNEYLVILTRARNSREVTELLSRRNVIRQKIESEIVSHGLEKAFKNLDIVKNQKGLDRFRLLRDKHKNIESSITASAINYLFLRFLPSQGGFPLLYPPKLNLTRNKALSGELIEKIKKQGFDASYDDLAKIFGKSAAFDAVYSKARTLYLNLFMVYAGYLIYQQKGLITFALSSLFVSEEDVARHIRDNVSAEQIRQQQFEGWKQGMYDFTGKWPTPEEQDKQWELLGELATSFKSDLEKEGP